MTVKERVVSVVCVCGFDAVRVFSAPMVIVPVRDRCSDAVAESGYLPGEGSQWRETGMPGRF
jgi:hypothetical protein